MNTQAIEILLNKPEIKIDKTHEDISKIVGLNISADVKNLNLRTFIKSLVSQFKQLCTNTQLQEYCNNDWTTNVDSLTTTKNQRVLNILYYLRYTIVLYIKKYICPDVCNNFGSINISSDVDITIALSTFENLNASIEYLQLIKRFLVTCFDSNIFTYDKICNLFDLNVYVSDFLIFKTDKSIQNNTDIQVRNIRISNEYGKTQLSQYAFAFQKYQQTEEISKLTVATSKETPYEAALMTGQALNNMLDGRTSSALDNEQKKSNAMVKRLSIISVNENECYHSQGAFLHVVLMMQRHCELIASTDEEKRDLRNLLRASIIENMCFAVKKTQTMKKYVNRYMDGLRRLNEIKITENFPEDDRIERVFGKINAANKDISSIKSALDAAYGELVGMVAGMVAGMVDVKRLVAKNGETVKKMGRVVYVDGSRRQWVKMNGRFVPLMEARLSLHKKTH